MSNWSKVYESKKPYRAEIVKDIIEQHGIKAILMNRKDSAYDIFGHVEIHVEAEEVLTALRIIEDEVKFEEV